MRPERRHLALAALLVLLGGPAAAQARTDAELAANPALARVAARDPAAAAALLAEIGRVLAQPARPTGRSAPLLDGADLALLQENPLLGEVFAHDAGQALLLLQRIRQAGGGKAP